MKTNIRKKELIAKLEALMEHIQEVGATIGNEELNYMTDSYRDQFLRSGCRYSKWELISISALFY